MPNPVSSHVSECSGGNRLETGDDWRRLELELPAPARPPIAGLSKHQGGAITSVLCERRDSASHVTVRLPLKCRET